MTAPVNFTPAARKGDEPCGRRRSYRFREHHIVADEEPDAEPLSFSAECAVCEQFGPEEETSEAAGAWIVRHLKANPEHLTYRERLIRPLRAVPGRWL
ncbi:hypothetical protein GCM10009716_48020 [Streptomyces sodiiphilus]|uniref:DUF7848 domain-containing protein n=1 Tax=Streptomyces sodiiphilus TaxID=226217 RepID=A0ABN2PZ46_9ACTN